MKYAPPPPPPPGRQTALCLYKLGRPVEALPLAESALTSCCSEDAKRFQLRGLVLHDLKRYGDAVKVRVNAFAAPPP